LQSAALQAAADFAVGMVVQRQIGPAFSARLPLCDSRRSVAECRGHRLFRQVSIGPCGRRRNVRFLFQALAKLLIALADVFAQRVSPKLFVTL
jgi:hypothetical protein